MLNRYLVAAVALAVAAPSYAQNAFNRSTSAITTATYPHPVPAGNFALTQSGSLDITALNSVSCNDGVGHTDNSYYRRFNLDGNFAATGTVTISSVDIGIEEASSSGGTQPITVNLYAIPNGAALTVANLGSPIATAPVTLSDQTGTLLNVPISGSLDGLANDLVLEVFTPDGQTAGNLMFIGSNTTASVNPAGAPSYIRAAGCGIADPTPTSDIGFPGMNIVMVVNATSLPVSLQEFNID